MIIRNGTIRDTISKGEGRCTICPKDALPFLERCFEHSMPEQIAQALVECHTAAQSMRGTLDELERRIDEDDRRIKDLQRNGWLYRAWSFVLPLIAAVGALSILGQCLNWK